MACATNAARSSIASSANLGAWWRSSSASDVPLAKVQTEWRWTYGANRNKGPKVPCGHGLGGSSKSRPEVCIVVEPVGAEILADRQVALGEQSNCQFEAHEIHGIPAWPSRACESAEQVVCEAAVDVRTADDVVARVHP